MRGDASHAESPQQDAGSPKVTKVLVDRATDTCKTARVPRNDRSRRVLRHSLAFSAGTAILLSSAAAGAYVDPACADGTNVSACCRADQTLVSGSAGPDIINASTSDDSSCVLADAADDIVQGRSGADSLVGGVGND